MTVNTKIKLSKLNKQITGLPGQEYYQKRAKQVTGSTSPKPRQCPTWRRPSPLSVPRHPQSSTETSPVPSPLLIRQVPPSIFPYTHTHTHTHTHMRACASLSSLAHVLGRSHTQVSRTVIDCNGVRSSCCSRSGRGDHVPRTKYT